MGTLPTVRDEHFDAINSPDEEELLRRFGGFVRNLHGWLNDQPCVKDIQTVRRRWKRPTNTDAFGTFAADPYHWYTFHHGGRTEAQFNLGLYPTHFRVGLGFEFSMKKGGDPTIVGLVYTCSLEVIRQREQEFRTFVQDQGLEIEWCSQRQPKLQFISNDAAVDFLLKPPSEPLWIFVGRLLRRNADKTILEHPDRLGDVIVNIFGGFRPLWEATQLMAR
jgi:hypothetical protein